MKRCSHCKKLLPLSSFYRSKRTPDGLLYECKRCHCDASMESAKRNRERSLERKRKWARIAYRRDPQKFLAANRLRAQRDLVKHRARKALEKAVQTRKILKPKACPQCGATDRRIEGHHTDYTKPLEVIWLCSRCHGEAHKGRSKRSA